MVTGTARFTSGSAASTTTGRPFALFQRRSQSKDSWPGTLDVAVGGHIRAGETLAQAVREAEEEIGLSVALEDLSRLGRRLARGATGKDNEVQEVFGVRCDLPLDAYRLHPDEVDAVVSVPLAAALALFEGCREAVQGTELRRGSRTPSTTRSPSRASQRERPVGMRCMPCVRSARWSSGTPSPSRSISARRRATGVRPRASSAGSRRGARTTQ